MKLVTDVRNLLTSYPLVPGIKHVIAAGQHDEIWRAVRPPMVELDEAKGEALVAALDQAGYIYDPELYSVAGA
jgi:dihydrodipicolinate synthase/N-acetylneuraminate lyase